MGSLAMARSLLLEISLEAQNDGKKALEKELMFVGRLKNKDDLKKADEQIEQEQWIVRGDTDPESFVRVRSENKKTFILTIKQKNPNGHMDETEMECTRDMFEGVKALAKEGMVKTRYIFKVPDNDKLRWEIDVYYDDKGEFTKWCKVDLEVEDLRMKLPDFPVEFEEIIVGCKDKLTKEDEKKKRDEAFAEFVTYKDK